MGYTLGEIVIAEDLAGKKFIPEFRFNVETGPGRSLIILLSAVANYQLQFP
jgi:hypothetical protein